MVLSVSELLGKGICGSVTLSHRPAHDTKYVDVFGNAIYVSVHIIYIVAMSWEIKF